MQCGWCGAITDVSQQQTCSSQHQLGAAKQSLAARLLQCTALTGRWLLVIIVVAIICLVMVVGILVVQPRALADSSIAGWVLHAGFTVLLVFNVSALINQGRMHALVACAERWHGFC